MEHNFKEFRFEPDGELMGFRTAIQEWKCKCCGLIIELPMSMKPTDYHNGRCKGEPNGHRTDSNDVQPLRGDIRLQSGNQHPRNRHEMRRMRVQQRDLQGKE